MLHVLITVPLFGLEICIYTYVYLRTSCTKKFLLFFSFKKDIMNSEKSYDSLPNFTAADCKYLVMLVEVALGVSLCLRAVVSVL